MRRPSFPNKLRSALMACAAGAVLWGGLSPALAHKVIASGYAAGDHIEGEVGFSNGDAVPGAVVTVTAPDGTRLGEVTTDADGFFTFTPTQAVPHVFRGDLGQGHVAEFTLGLSELPKGLRDGPDASAVGAQAGANSASVSSVPSLNGISDAALRDMVAEAVRDEIRPLRKELIASREQASVQSIMGGIGTLLGLVGVGYFMVARRKLAEAEGKGGMSKPASPHTSA